MWSILDILINYRESLSQQIPIKVYTSLFIKLIITFNWLISLNKAMYADVLILSC